MFFSQSVGSSPDLSHHTPLFCCQSSCGEILTSPSTAKLALPHCIDLNRLITQFTLSYPTVKIGQVTAQSELCQHMRTLLHTPTHPPSTCSHSFAHTELAALYVYSHADRLYLYVWHTCRRTYRNRGSQHVLIVAPKLET